MGGPPFLPFLRLVGMVPSSPPLNLAISRRREEAEASPDAYRPEQKKTKKRGFLPEN